MVEPGEVGGVATCPASLTSTAKTPRLHSKLMQAKRYVSRYGLNIGHGGQAPVKRLFAQKNVGFYER